MLTHMTSSLTQIVASGIRAEMARQGKTQQQVASLAGMAQQTLSRRIRIEDPIPFDTAEIDRVAQALGIPVLQLLIAPATAGAA
jgi:transcriptional regulator with XRE-family HTH domain